MRHAFKKSINRVQLRDMSYDFVDYDNNGWVVINRREDLHHSGKIYIFRFSAFAWWKFCDKCLDATEFSRANNFAKRSAVFLGHILASAQRCDVIQWDTIKRRLELQATADSWLDAKTQKETTYYIMSFSWSGIDKFWGQAHILWALDSVVCVWKPLMRSMISLNTVWVRIDKKKKKCFSLIERALIPNLVRISQFDCLLPLRLCVCVRSHESLHTSNKTIRHIRMKKKKLNSWCNICTL